MSSTTDSAPDTNPSGPRAPPTPLPTPPRLPTSYRDSLLHPLFALLLAFRLANALTLRTFFQPDEFFQSLEPAWQLAFGPAANAWITWVKSSSPLAIVLFFLCLFVYLFAYMYSNPVSHHLSRSGQHSCALLCIRPCSQPSIVWRHVSLKLAG